MLKRKFTRNEAYDMKYYENINKLMGGKKGFSPGFCSVSGGALMAWLLFLTYYFLKII